jgi:hypothetical protein
MVVELIPEALRARFRFDERNHATAVLASDFPNEFADIVACLSAFTLKRSQITVGGGGRSAIPIAIDGFLERRGWIEKKFDIEIAADGNPIPIPTHKIDNYQRSGCRGPRFGLNPLSAFERCLHVIPRHLRRDGVRGATGATRSCEPFSSLIVLVGQRPALVFP